MVETVVILFVALLLGIIQFGLIYNAKTTLNYAAFEAARVGALNFADRTSIEYGLARGLSPLYTSVTKADGRLDTVKKVQSARDRVFDEIEDGEFVCIERVNPDRSAFVAYGVPDSTGNFPGEQLIPNDHLLYRSALVKGATTVSIQDANLLKLRVTYCYPMYVPFISNTVKRLYGLMYDPRPSTTRLTPAGSFQRNCLEKDRFPIVAQAVIGMQTPVRNDDFPRTVAECAGRGRQALARARVVGGQVLAPRCR